MFRSIAALVAITLSCVARAAVPALPAGAYVATDARVVAQGRTCEIGSPLAPSHVLVVHLAGSEAATGAVGLMRDDSGAALALASSADGNPAVLSVNVLAQPKESSAGGTIRILEAAPRLVVDIDYRRALPDCRVRGRLTFELADDTVREHVSGIAAAFGFAVRRDALSDTGAWREALDPAQAAYSAFERQLGAEHPMTLAAKVKLAELHWQLDELATARRLNDESIASLTKALGSDAYAVLQARQAQALVRWYQGEVEDAERELRDVLRRYESLLDADDVERITARAHLGALLIQRGRLVESERILFDVLARFERVLGPSHPRTLVVLNNLAVLLDNGGRLDESLPMYASLIERYDRTVGRAHPHALYALMNQADTLGRLHRYDEAIPIAREVLRGLHAQLGFTHTDVLLAQHNLAWLLEESGRIEEAWILQRALVTLRDRVDGANSREALKARNSLGGLEVKRGEVQTGLARMASALDAAKRSLGEQDPTTLEIAARFAASQRAAGRVDGARQTLRELVARLEDWRDRGAMTAETRRAFLAPWVTSYKSLAALELAAGDIRAAFDQVERSKARVLVELLSRRRGESPDVLPADALEQLAKLDRALVEAETRVAQASEPSARAPLELARIAIADDARNLRGALRERHPKYRALSQARIASLEEGAAALPGSALFVSYLRDGDRVLAFTVDAGGRFTGRDLGAFAGLDDAIVAYRALLIGAQDAAPPVVWRLADGRFRVSVSAPAGARRVKDAAQIGALLYERLVARLPGLRDVQRLIVSPDGALAILPFEALPYRGRPLVASYDVSYAPSLTVYALTAARAREYDRLSDRLPLYAMGGATYDASRAPEIPRQNLNLPSLTEALKDDPLGVRRAYDFVNARWAPLPGSLVEIRDVAAQFPAGATTLRAQQDATERRLIEDDRNGTLARHRYVLLSAHGLLSTEAPSLSAVVLGQDDVTPDADGYVTAAEWTGYTLRSDLIVISACQTGAGRIIAGEGVAGLPYALFVAGNRNALLTLWPVADESTALFVSRFFAHLRGGLPQSEALTRTKREFATKGRHTAPFHWAAFTLWGT